MHKRTRGARGHPRKSVNPTKRKSKKASALAIFSRIGAHAYKSLDPCCDHCEVCSDTRKFVTSELSKLLSFTAVAVLL